MKRIIAFCLIGVIILVGVVGTTLFFTVAYPLRFKNEINEAATRFNLPPELIASIIRAESSFRPNAIGPRGEIGLMQLMPSTAAWLASSKMDTPGLEKQLNVPRVNITFGSFYIRYLLDKFDGDVRTALIAYNAGPAKAQRWLDESEYSRHMEQREGKRVLISSPYPSTNHYVARILRAQRHYRWRL
ncbi:MAG: lytic transglycosylase domain-containing protein [Firmicutes bacterium]|nr:lytic transglycosylase domain-containing protein [Bacillota bacterium]